MKKRTLSKLKSIFGSKKGKRQAQQEQTSKSSRSPSPVPAGAASPVNGDLFRPIIRTPPPSRVGPPPSPPVPTHPVAPVAPEPAAPLPLMPCLVCGRTFVPQSLAKHVKICEKMTVKKRKTFDSSRQRREGTDLEQYLPKNFGLPENSPFLEKSPPPTAKPAPKPKPQSTRSVITKPMAELQRCPHCQRAFGVRAFERHVEWCADKAKILPAAPAQPPPHIADAKQRLNARTQYKAPPVRGRRSSQTRDKSSNSRSGSVDSSRGVSPPPAPRECGDYRRGRTRASESGSSNDCPEDTSPHVPVIRNSRNSQGSSSGDANVKARQARLAKDLSNSRNAQDPCKSSVQQSNTDPNIKKYVAQNKPKNKLIANKQQQLKKLEEIAKKYNEKKQENKTDVRSSSNKHSDKSQIPVSNHSQNGSTDKEQNVSETCKKLKKLPAIRNNKNRTHSLQTPSDLSLGSNCKQIPDEENKAKVSSKKTKIKKESSMSQDSLENTPIASNKDQNCQTIGINTELLCIPCKIHENMEHKKSCRKEKNTNGNHHTGGMKSDNPEPKVELLYKNPILGDCGNDQKTYPKENLSIAFCINTPSISTNFACDSLESVTTIETENKINQQFVSYSDDKVAKNHEEIQEKCANNQKSDEDSNNLSVEHFEENYEHDLSAELFDDHENKFDNVNEESELGARHGSGETYTKFTEDPADLEEFLAITDKLMNNHVEESSNTIREKDVEALHTPATNSIEAINTISPNLVNPEPIKHGFSDTFEELKSNLKELLKGAKAKDVIRKADEILKKSEEATGLGKINNEENKKVSDMEHITVYGLKFYEKSPIENVVSKITPPEIKLPSIEETNKPKPKVECNKKRMQKIYKPNRKVKMLGEQARANKEYQTFIVTQNTNDNSDDQSISSDAPPLKLPRIENKRLDDNYDPFVSAARQMRELMSSDTNIPKKIQNISKDTQKTRTLPVLQPTKDKSISSYLRSDNTKMMKDTLNKTYQKTPTLQRMKSFGSTNNDNGRNTFGGRCSSFRLNRNEKKPTPKLNTTFTKSSKENISIVDKSYFNRNSNLNRSFSSYSASCYSTPKPKDKIPKIATSMYHSFQRSTTKQPVKLEKIKRDDEKKNFVNLDAILTDDNSSMTDSNYIDPRLINENDNLPINVSTILSNPDIISSMESLLTTENLPKKFESFSSVTQNNNESYIHNNNTDSKIKVEKLERNNNFKNKTPAPIVDDLSIQYDKIMHSLEQSIASKTSIRDDDSLCEDFDLEEFITSFDEEIHKHKSENKRTCSSTTRIVKQSEIADSNRTSELSSVSSSPKIRNGMLPVNKSMSLNFSSNNVVSENLFPSSVKRSTSLLDSIQKKNVQKIDNAKCRQKSDQLEQDIMQSLKDFDKFYESEKTENHSAKDVSSHNGTSKRVTRLRPERKINKKEIVSNGNHTPNGKTSNDSAYSSLNRISPSKLSLCTPKETNGLASLEQIPGGSDSGSHKEDARSLSSEEFLAMERSAELDVPLPQLDSHPHKEPETHGKDKVGSSRASSVLSKAGGASGSWGGRRGSLSSSGSEASLPRVTAPRRSRFCHECGHKFPVDTANFCIECGVRRLVV